MLIGEEYLLNYKSKRILKFDRLKSRVTFAKSHSYKLLVMG